MASSRIHWATGQRQPRGDDHCGQTAGRHPAGGPSRLTGQTGPGFTGPAALSARTVAAYLAADDEADGALLAFFTGDGSPGGHPAGHARRRRLLDATVRPSSPGARRICRCGTPGTSATDFWRDAYCIDPSCCAPPGRPVDEIRDSPLNAEMVFRGSSSVGAAPRAPMRRRLRANPGRIWRRSRTGRGNSADSAGSRAQFGQILDVWIRRPECRRGPGATGGTRRLPACQPAGAGLAGRRARDDRSRPGSCRTGCGRVWQLRRPRGIRRGRW